MTGEQISFERNNEHVRRGSFNVYMIRIASYFVWMLPVATAIQHFVFFKTAICRINKTLFDAEKSGQLSFSRKIVKKPEKGQKNKIDRLSSPYIEKKKERKTDIWKIRTKEPEDTKRCLMSLGKIVLNFFELKSQAARCMLERLFTGFS